MYSVNWLICNMEKIIMKIPAFALIGFLALASICLASPDLTALCKDQPLALTRISQVVSLIEEAGNSPQGECGRKLTEALNDLKPILTEGMDDVCNVNKANQIVDFHKKYISKSNWRVWGASLPASLERFVLAFGVKVGTTCRQAMLSSLVEVSQKQLTKADFHSLDVDSGNLLTAVKSKLKGLDDILLLSDIARPHSRELIYIETSFSSRAKRIQVACERRFKPFYEKLVLPFAILSLPGYSITSTDTEQELAELKSNGTISSWYYIALICETFTKVETFNSNDSNSRNLHVLKRAEADALRQVQQGQISQSGRRVADQLSYKPVNKRPVADLVVNETDSQLLRQVGEFRARRKTLRQMRRKALRRLAGVLKTALLSSHQVSFISSFFKSRKPDNNLDLIETLERRIKQEDDSEGILVRRRRGAFADFTEEAKNLPLEAIVGFIICVVIVISTLLYTGVIG